MKNHVERIPAAPIGSVWVAILQKVKQARLLLLRHTLDSPGLADHLNKVGFCLFFVLGLFAHLKIPPYIEPPLQLFGGHAIIKPLFIGWAGLAAGPRHGGYASSCWASYASSSDAYSTPFRTKL